MRIGIVACEAFRKEMELLTKGDRDVAHMEFLDFGLHVYPKKMKETLVEKVRSLEGKVDSVFLAYGYCQSLKGITRELPVPTAMLDADDCIGALLTPEVYEEERRTCAGTWFATPFFSENTVGMMEKEMHLDNIKMKNPKYDAMWFLRKFFESYSRCLYVDTCIGNRDHYEEKARDFAKLLNLRYESRDGTLRLLAEGLNEAKKLAKLRLTQ